MRSKGVATYLKGGGHTYEGAERPSWEGLGGVPPHTVWKIFHFKNPEVTSATF